MYALAKMIQVFFPFVALILLIIGIKRKALHYIISSLWLSLIAVLIHFQFSGNQIFGSYFDMSNAAVYSFSLLVLLASLICVISHLGISYSFFRYTSGVINAFLVVGAFLVIINLWINAFFITNVKEGTPVMQVALFDKPDYCQYKYVFYKVTPENTVMYLCPNQYGLIAAVGRLATNPDFVLRQLHLPSKKHITQQ